MKELGDSRLFVRFEWLAIQSLMRVRREGGGRREEFCELRLILRCFRCFVVCSNFVFLLLPLLCGFGRFAMGQELLSSGRRTLPFIIGRR